MFTGLALQDLKKVQFTLDSSCIVDVTDGEGRIIYVNGSFSDISGYELNELVGKNHRIINSGFHSKEFFTDLWKTLLSGKTWVGELRNKKKTGEFYWVQTTITPFIGRTPKDTRFVAIHKVITSAKEDQSRLQTALRELEDRNFALDQTAIVAITDVSGVITYVNKKFCDISKYSQEELIGKTHKIINSGHHEPEFFKNMWKTISCGKIWRGEIKNKAKDGSYYWVDTTIIPSLNENGRPIKYTAIRQDITNKVLANEKIERERAKAMYAEKMASLGELSAGIAHELGNPLGAMRGRLEMLGFQISNEEVDLDRNKASETIQKVIFLADRMTNIIRGLRSYARDGSNDPFAPTSLNQLISDILDFSADKFRTQGIKDISVRLDPNIIIECREAEIGQVIVNLISNACDAIKELSEKWLRVELIGKEDVVIIRVIDSGSGIHNEQIQRIFEPYFTTKPVGRGTGLGLSISKNIIQAHRGEMRIDLDSPNTCFEIKLPYKPDAQ